MLRFSHQMRASLHQIWNQLTRPLYPVSNHLIEQRVRALASILLLSSIVSTTGTALILLVAENKTTFIAAFASAVIGFVLYGFSRTRFYQSVATIYIAAIYLTPIALDLSQIVNSPDRPFLFLILTVILASLFYPIYVTSILAVLNLMMIVVASFLASTATGFISVLMLNALVSALVVVISFARQSDLQRVKDSETRYRQLMEANFEAVIVCNNAGRIIDVNQAFERTFKYTRSEVLGKLPDELGISIPEPSPTKQFYEPDETVAISKVGLPLNIEVNTHLQQSDDQMLRISVIRDITARKRHNVHYVELALQQERVKMLRGFIDDASHYFRTPIASMKTNLYLAEKTAEQPDRQDKHLAVIKTEIRRLEELLNNLLTMTRLEKEETADYLYVGRFDINQMLKDVVAMKSDLGDDVPDVKLNFSDKLLPYVFGDKMQLSDAFKHLIDNARLYSRGKPPVEIRTTTDDNQMQIRIEIEDHGIGISEADKPNIFQSFYRSDAAREVAFERSGLGLTIAKKIIDRHRGAIHVRSEPDEGSTFCVILPSVHALPGAIKRVAGGSERETQEAPVIRRMRSGRAD